MTLSRRRLLENGGRLALGAATPLGAATFPGSAASLDGASRLHFRARQGGYSGDVLVVVFQRGGADGLNMVPPYGDENDYFDRRPSIAIPAPDDPASRKALDLDGFFGLHPALGSPDAGNWIEWFQEGVLAVVQAMHMDSPTRSHFDAMDYMERGTPGEKRVDSGWLGRHLETTAGGEGSPFRGVGMSSMLQASLRGTIPAVALRSIADFHLLGLEDEIERFQEHLQLLHEGDGWLHEEGRKTFDAVALLSEEVGSATYQPEHGASYNSSDGFHTGLMQVARLVKADVGLEVACVDITGWDTHANQVTADDPTQGYMATLLQRLGTGVTAFLTDLSDYLNEPGISLVTMSEFGRRATENGGLGTDHGHGNCMFVFGGGIKGGKVYRDWPGLSDDDLDRGDLAGTIEYRDVLGELLSKRLGSSRITDVFPTMPAFNFVGLAEAKQLAPTAEPTDEPTPTSTATPDGPEGRVYLPWAERS